MKTLVFACALLAGCSDNPDPPPNWCYEMKVSALRLQQALNGGAGDVRYRLERFDATKKACEAQMRNAAPPLRIE